MTLDDEDVQKLLSAFIPVFATKEDLRQLKEEMATKEQYNETMNRILKLSQQSPTN